jgi:ATP-dependent DNA helicase RecQ
LQLSSAKHDKAPVAEGAQQSGLDLDGALARLGYERFRPGQREAIERLLEARKLLLVAPTGDGKSLTYQLPATLLPGTTIVVSPLIALMADQVAALQRRGVAATYLAATLEGNEARERMASIAAGEHKLVYVAPERLAVPGFRRLLSALDCPLLVIDEAHCISEWGHDFRPEYLQIGSLISALPQARVLACTATATPVVRDEIMARLGLPSDTPQVLRGFARPNLALAAAEVSGKRDAQARVDALLEEALGFPGSSGRGAAIIYAPTRARAEQEAERLGKKSARVGVYHAGLSPDAREKCLRGFTLGKIEVVVATNAFGMGIDRADVRAVVHLSPPSSIEAYYQEVGRAGRDGEPAHGLMLSSVQDLPLRRFLIERGAGEGSEPSPEVVEHKWQLFLELMRWADGGSCRHDAILRYFGDEAETLHGCGRCDVCLSLDQNHEQDDEDAVVIVRKALSAVARIHGRFGLQTAVKLLAGKHDERFSYSGLDRTRTFGALASFSEERLVALLRRCVTAGFVSFAGADRPVVLLTAEGIAAMKGERPVRMLVPSEPKKRGRRERGGEGGARASKGRVEVALDQLDPQAEALFSALRAHRMAVAKSEGVPPYVVASDRTLRELCILRPKSRGELLAVHGIGAAKAERYGEGLLQVVAANVV